MNKDKLEVGDLVRPRVSLDLRVGLVIDDHVVSSWCVLKYRVLWLKTGSILRHSRNSLIKLDIPNE